MSSLHPLPPALDDEGRAQLQTLAETMGRGTLVRALLTIMKAHPTWFLQHAVAHLWELYGSGQTCPTCGAWPRDLDAPQDAPPPTG